MNRTPARPPAGLCDSCRHQKIIRTGRGSEFSMCLRSKDDERYPKYPRVPVGSCPGYEGRSSTREMLPSCCWMCS